MLTTTSVTYLDQPAIRITADTPRELRAARSDIQARGFWVVTTNEPVYSLIAHPHAVQS